MSANTTPKFEGPLAFTQLDLPDGSIAFQRRTFDAPSSPDMLQFFGGHIEEGETLLQAATRELKEETDLPVDEMELEEVGLFFVPKKSGINRVAGLVRAGIPHANFNDFEGQGRPEIWTPESALRSGQLVTTVRYILEKTVNLRPVNEA